MGRASDLEESDSVRPSQTKSNQVKVSGWIFLGPPGVSQIHGNGKLEQIFDNNGQPGTTRESSNFQVSGQEAESVDSVGEIKPKSRIQCRKLNRIKPN